MHQLFGISKLGNVGVVSVPGWNYIRDGLRKNLQTVTDYYHRYPVAVDGSHFLIRLIHSLGIPRALPADRFYLSVESVALNMAMSLGMTSSIFRGELFDGVFYGKGIKEVIIAHTTDFDPVKAEKDWKNLRPITVLRHPISDMGFQIPDGKRSGNETGLAVIAINIPMLAMQYRAFRREQEFFRQATGESERSINMYIHGYALTNMMYSHVDNVIFNRMSNLYEGKPMGACTRKHPFHLTDFAAALNKVQNKQLDNLESVSRRFDDMLKNMPMVSVESASELADLPDVAPTRQVVWGLVLARMNLLSFLFATASAGARAQNGMEVNNVIRAFRSYRSDKLFYGLLPQDDIEDLQYEIQDILGTREYAA